MTNERVLLIVPCFNEAKRIDMVRFKNAPASVSFLFVDDGSLDDTSYQIQSSLDNRMHFLRLDRNVGKGEAIRRGVLYASERPEDFNFEWIGYWDADLSTPLYEVDNFLLYAATFYGEVDAIFGSRVLRFGGDIQRHSHRHYLGRLFATVGRWFFGVGSYDSQCGAKIFKKAVLKRCFVDEFVSRWIFDVEIVLRLGNRGIVEYPLKEWRDVSGGKLNVFKTAFTVLGDIYRMRKKYRCQ